MPDEPTVDAVRDYYDRFSRRFARLGQGGPSLHRAVREPGPNSAAGPFHTVDLRVAAALGLGPERPARVLDLGCGLAESLVHLAGGHPHLTGTGVTLSGVQADLAGQRVRASGLADRLEVVRADMTALPEDLGSYDGALAVESLVHVADTDAFFAAAAAHLRPGAVLAVCDDFRLREPDSAREERWLADIRTGWLGLGLTTVAATATAATRHGLHPEGDDDLTRYLDLRRPRDRAVSALLAVARPLRADRGYLRSLAGGDALQRALVGGLVGYHFLAFRSGVQNGHETHTLPKGLLP